MENDEGLFPELDRTGVMMMMMMMMMVVMMSIYISSSPACRCYTTHTRVTMVVGRRVHIVSEREACADWPLALLCSAD